MSSIIKEFAPMKLTNVDRIVSLDFYTILQVIYTTIKKYSSNVKLFPYQMLPFKKLKNVNLTLSY